MHLRDGVIIVPMLQRGNVSADAPASLNKGDATQKNSGLCWVTLEHRELHSHSGAVGTIKMSDKKSMGENYYASSSCFLFALLAWILTKTMVAKPMMAGTIIFHVLNELSSSLPTENAKWVSSSSPLWLMVMWAR